MSTTTPTSPLRRRMIEDMTVRGFGEKTQSDYIRHVKNFTIFLGRSPDTAEGEDLRAFQVRQRAQGVQPPTMNGAVAALRSLRLLPLYPQDLPKTNGCDRSVANSTRPARRARTSLPNLFG